jgi:hypothetical protein
MTRPKRTPSRKGPVCSICRHPDRARIEAGRVAGVSLDNVSAKFGVSRDAVHRHMARHVDEETRLQYISDTPIRELAQRASEEGVSLIDYFGIIRGVLMQQFQLAAACNDKTGTAILAGRLTEVLREIGRITGEIMRTPGVMNVSNTVNFINSPMFADLQTMLIKRLAGHPEAMAAVVEGLRDLEGRSAPPPTAPMMIEHGGAHAA